jgi:hypothetical protein
MGAIRDVRAVSVVCGNASCEAAKTLKGQRQLMSSAVVLPLASCGSPAKCKCRYQKYTDRRDEDDRRAPGSTARAALFGIKERRNVGGRRPADF